MKKEILILGAALALVLALTACGGKNAAKPSDAQTSQETQSAPAWAPGPDTVTDDFLAHGSTASLIWFWADGGLVYNEEFSRLPGEPARDGGC